MRAHARARDDSCVTVRPRISHFSRARELTRVRSGTHDFLARAQDAHLAEAHVER